MPIQAKPGEKLRIVLKPTGTMPKIAMSHNFVMLKPGSNDARFAEASAMACPDFIAPALKSQVLVATAMAGNGETVSAERRSRATTPSSARSPVITRWA